jgi:hypothetical protein
MLAVGMLRGQDNEREELQFVPLSVYKFQPLQIYSSTRCSELRTI